MTVVVTLLIVKHYGKLFDSLYTLAMVRVNYHTLTRKMSLSTPLAKVCPPSSATTPSSPWPGTTWTPRSSRQSPSRESGSGTRDHRHSAPVSLALSLPHSPSFSHVRVVICVLRNVFLARVSVSEPELLWGEF